MQYLIPPILHSEVVDRYDIWINTNDMVDIEFFKLLAQKYSKINLAWQPDNVVDWVKTINAFYRACTEPDTIYMKLDDDVVWLEPELFDKMVKFRVDHPDYFLVSPLVINNALCTYLLQINDKIKLRKYYDACCSHPVLWESGYFAADLHHWFLDNYLRTDKYRELYTGEHPMAMTRFSINCILWFGEMMKAFNGIVPGDDEEFLSCIKPTQLGLSNCINGDAVISHFAFGPQREILDRQGILDSYGEFLHQEWNKDASLNAINQKVQEAIRDVNSRTAQLRTLSSPYTKVRKKPSIGRNINKRVPKNLRRGVKTLFEREHRRFIVTRFNC